jgi:hypothetical protein
VGRKSKLTDAQWEQVEKRLLGGEKAADLSREFKVSVSVISRRFSQSAKSVKEVANQLVAADHALKALPIAQQVLAISLADDLRAISTHLAGAAKFGSATAHRLAGVAHAKVQELDDADPLSAESINTLKGVSVLTDLANKAATTGLNLLAANRDSVKALNEERPKATSIDPSQLSSATLHELLKVRG